MGNKAVEQVILTVDMVILQGDSILLIKRRKWPYQDMWALPGGKLDTGETLDQAAARELWEETGVAEVALEQIGLLDTPLRDPRGRYISVLYRARVEKETSIQAGDDASEAQWFSLGALPPLAFDHEFAVKLAI